MHKLISGPIQPNTMQKITEAIIQKRVHFFTSEIQIVSGLVAATAATLFATSLGYWFKGVGWTPFDFNSLNGLLWSGAAAGNGLKLSADSSFAVGVWAHTVQGIFFGLLFVFVIHPNWPGGLSQRDNLLKGLVWGWLLWLISSSIWMPLLFSSGFLFSTWGYVNLFYNFIWHSGFGLTLGLLYNPLLKSTDSTSSTTSTETMMEMVAKWSQVAVGTILILIGGYVATSSASATGVVFSVGAIGAIIVIVGVFVATGPSLWHWKKK